MPTHPASKIEQGMRMAVDEKRHRLSVLSPDHLKVGFSVSIHHGIGVVDVDGVEDVVLWHLTMHGVK